MKRFIQVLFSFFLVVAFAPWAAAQQYDLVISGGRVMDPETLYDDVANVGIKDGRIAAITKDRITGRESIDATGLVVAPGFIDTHFHWPRPIGYKLALRDGVTTPMDLEAGVFGPKVGEWYDMHKGQSQANYGTASGHEFARGYVFDGYIGLDAPASVVEGRSGKGWATGVLDLEKGNKLLETIDEGLRQGGLGIASTLGYFPGATAREMFEIQKVGARYGRFTSVHLRYTPGTATTEANGAQEILANAIALGAPAVINHYNNPGWELVQEMLVRLRERGFNVWGEYYPYAAGSTTINAAFVKPDVWVKQLGNKYEETLQDPDTGEFYTQSRYDKDVKENPTKQIILYKMPPDDIPDWVRMPGVVMGSDAMMLPGGWDQFPWDTPYAKLPNLHPRTAGSHGKSLRIARENNIPLMHVLATFSYNPAKYLGKTGLKAMQERGRMQKGMIADITIFDPDTVTDNATYKEGLKPTTGIPYVLVNGQVVVKNERVLKDVFPGQPIRFPVQEKGRFEPLDVDAWRGQYLVAPPTGFNALDPEQVKKSAVPETNKKRDALKSGSQAAETKVGANAGSRPAWQLAEGSGDWFSKTATFTMPPAAHEVFCPVHGRMETAGEHHMAGALTSYQLQFRGNKAQ